MCFRPFVAIYRVVRSYTIWKVDDKPIHGSCAIYFPGGIYKPIHNWFVGPILHQCPWWHASGNRSTAASMACAKSTSIQIWPCKNQLRDILKKNMQIMVIIQFPLSMLDVLPLVSRNFHSRLSMLDTLHYTPKN